MKSHFESPSQPTLDQRYEAFSLLDHDQDWEGTANNGIPLYAELVAAGETDKATEIKKTLERLLAVMQHSGAGDPESKQRLAEQIQTALS